MIGQKTLWEKLLKQSRDDKFPRYTILVGARGSGRSSMADRIAKELLGAFYVVCNTKADDIREIVENSYKVTSKTLYAIPNANTLSTIAQNTLLKITEEPPNNAYFIMTVESQNQVLPTLLSRANVLLMDIYTQEQLTEYLESKYSVDDETKDFLLDVCETPGEIDLFMGQSTTAFIGFVSNVIDNIGVVSGANALKIAQQLNLGDEQDKYDLQLFWKAFMTKCLNSMSADPFKFSAGVRITSKYYQELRITGLNKQMCFDNWLLELREDWMSYANN